jgi:hypothetical protein
MIVLSLKVKINKLYGMVFKSFPIYNHSKITQLPFEPKILKL